MNIKIIFSLVAFIIVAGFSFAKADTLYRELQMGMSGPDVSALQTFLAKDRTIYPQGLVTGHFGFLTKSAVSNFQARNGISAVGRVGPQTLAVLNAKIASQSTASNQGLNVTDNSQINYPFSSTVPGCTADALFSTTTGQPCVSSANTMPGCAAGNLYSTTTGQPCYPSTQTGNSQTASSSSSIMYSNTTIAATSSDTTLAVSLVPLLSGGVARAGSSVPISYLQITNMGANPATVTGFWVKQNGSAPVQSVIGFTTVDDKGGSQGATGAVEGFTPFKDGLAFAPTNAIFAPGQMRLFTIKAVLSANVSSYIGTQLMIDVASIETNGRAQGAFPIRGTTWTIAY